MTAIVRAQPFPGAQPFQLCFWVANPLKNQDWIFKVHFSNALVKVTKLRSGLVYSFKIV